MFLPGWFGVRSNDILPGEDKIILTDFGESFNPHQTPRSSSQTPPLLQPPEARFSDQPLSFASDIWTLACTIWEILGQRQLLESVFPTADRVTAEQVELLGLLPPEWWKKWDKRMEWFDEDGELNSEVKNSRGQDGVRWTWDQRFDFCVQKPRAEAGLTMVSVEERRAFEAMHRMMLVFRPQERGTVKQVLESEWMRDWGMPALEQSYGRTLDGVKCR